MCTILLSGCGYTIVKKVELQESEKALQEKINEAETLKQDDLFEKNLKCLEYKNEIKKQMEEYNKDNSLDWSYSLKEIFYSPKENVCLYVEQLDLGLGVFYRSLYSVLNDGKEVEDCEDYNRAIGRLEMLSKGMNPDTEDMSEFEKKAGGCDNFDEKIQKYKNASDSGQARMTF